jgi:SOS response associated peptidase (SRAP)
MPVILQPEDEEQWLDVSRTSFAKAQSLLKPYPEELMDAHDVSPIVNSAKYDGPECIRPVSEDEILAAVSCPCCDVAYDTSPKILGTGQRAGFC